MQTTSIIPPISRKGVLIGAIISLVLLIRRVSSPHVAFLGRIPGARRYSDLKRHADNEPSGIRMTA
jgi:MFS superfamily sulfate permease-like transporter